MTDDVEQDPRGGRNARIVWAGIMLFLSIGLWSTVTAIWIDVQLGQWLAVKRGVWFATGLFSYVVGFFVADLIARTLGNPIHWRTLLRIRGIYLFWTVILALLVLDGVVIDVAWAAVFGTLLFIVWSARPPRGPKRRRLRRLANRLRDALVERARAVTRPPLVPAPA